MSASSQPCGVFFLPLALSTLCSSKRTEQPTFMSARMPGNSSPFNRTIPSSNVNSFIRMIPHIQ